jgi:hypothetical protein
MVERDFDQSVPFTDAHALIPLQAASTPVYSPLRRNGELQ